MRKVLTVVMDGIGERESRYGNAAKLARTPNMDWLRQRSFGTLKAHGTAVGLPSDSDLGNSEVGHNAIGAGRVFDQGAKLVSNAIKDKSLFEGSMWRRIVEQVSGEEKTLHFIGLLSDGNVHSHEDHLHAMLMRAADEGVKTLRVHALLDGRDVSAHSAHIYIDRLENVLQGLRANGIDAQVASGGGRMSITMDRYEADWDMVQRGWETHVLGEGEMYPDVTSALSAIREKSTDGDQYLPAFVIGSDSIPIGSVQDGDGVIFFNFRGDRAIEISRAFEEEDFTEFDRRRWPKTRFAGMMEYDGDAHIPRNFLVDPPQIDKTLGEHLSHLGLRQFACSETQKFGHVTFFWNGNNSGCFDSKLESYLEIPSDNIPFHLKPAMKAWDITAATVSEMHKGSFDAGRINYANGDMVGHTGDFEAALVAVEIVDLMLGHLIRVAKKTKTILLITADHGNCDEMLEGKESDWPNWEQAFEEKTPNSKTSHTLSEVPVFIYDPESEWQVTPGAGLSNIAASILDLMGLDKPEHFDPSFVKPL